MAKRPSIELPPFEIPAGYALIVGVDEVGRGPLVLMSSRLR